MTCKYGLHAREQRRACQKERDQHGENQRAGWRKASSRAQARVRPMGGMAVPKSAKRAKKSSVRPRRRRAPSGCARGGKGGDSSSQASEVFPAPEPKSRHQPAHRLAEEHADRRRQRRAGTGEQAATCRWHRRAAAEQRLACRRRRDAEDAELGLPASRCRRRRRRQRDHQAVLGSELKQPPMRPAPGRLSRLRRLARRARSGRGAGVSARRGTPEGRQQAGKRSRALEVGERPASVFARMRVGRASRPKACIASPPSSRWPSRPPGSQPYRGGTNAALLRWWRNSTSV